MDAKDIYFQIKAIAAPINEYTDQMVAIAKWIESEFEYKPKRNDITASDVELMEANKLLAEVLKKLLLNSITNDVELYDRINEYLTKQINK